MRGGDDFDPPSLWSTEIIYFFLFKHFHGWAESWEVASGGPWDYHHPRLMAVCWKQLSFLANSPPWNIGFWAVSRWNWFSNRIMCSSSCSQLYLHLCAIYSIKGSWPLLVIAQHTYKCINIECDIKTQIIGFGRKHPRGKNKVSQKITLPPLIYRRNECTRQGMYPMPRGWYNPKMYGFF